MKIEEIEYTPNPNAVKFVLDEQLTPPGTTAEFKSAEEAEDVKLAREIFAIDHVISVFYTGAWLTVTQDGEVDWHGLMREVAEPIREATAADASLGGQFEARARARAEAEGDEDMGMDDPRVAQIQRILDEEVMPFLAGDGGGLEIKGLIDNQLLIKYQGACGTCPSATMGTLMAIENLVRTEIDPEIEVVSVDAGPVAAGGYPFW